MKFVPVPKWIIYVIMVLLTYLHAKSLRVISSEMIPISFSKNKATKTENFTRMFFTLLNVSCYLRSPQTAISYPNYQTMLEEKNYVILLQDEGIDDKVILSEGVPNLFYKHLKFVYFECIFWPVFQYKNRLLNISKLSWNQQPKQYKQALS